MLSTRSRIRLPSLALATLAGVLPAIGASAGSTPELPWRRLGWSEREAAAHALDRLAYGARPGDIDRVVAVGIDSWVAAQLAADPVARRLPREVEERLPALGMSAEEIARTYPSPGLLLRRADELGVIEREALEGAGAGRTGRREARRAFERWREESGYRPQGELLAQLLAQKLYGALEGERPLAETLTDFWFNHFNVSLSDGPVRTHLLAYERDAIRPHVLGSFREMLGATARHPAMLLYLDNARSVAEPDRPTTLDRERKRRGIGARRGRRAGGGANRPSGLNENYARELLELHTLGVDGGYTQQDVVEVARAFTGWTIFPAGPMPGAERSERRYAMVERAGGLGFVRDGLFAFRADAHDATPKRVLGRRIPAGGVDEGEAVLDLLATHPATARHLATKLARRFVADEPPPALVDRLAARFLETGGDLRAVTGALVASPEFWARDVRGSKIKSPFEAVVSALRALDARVDNPAAVLDRIHRMGQPLYAYAAPTGFPDRAEQWVSTGALLGRMNFGLELASGRLPGVRFDLDSLLGGREPASQGEALTALGGILLPERELSATVARLEPLLADPALGERLAAKAPQGEGLDIDDEESSRGATMEPVDRMRRRAERAFAGLFPPLRPTGRAGSVPEAPATVAGLLLGSPEFQRR